MGLLKLYETKIRLNVTNDENDILILTLIEDVSSLIELYCDRHFTDSTYTEYIDGLGKDYFYTKEYPIISIESIYEDSLGEFTSSSLIDSSFYDFYSEVGKIIGKGIIFTKGSKNIKIIYRAGYSEIPSDLKMVASEIIMKKYKNIMDKRIGLNSVSSAGETISFSLNDLLPDQKLVLNFYKNRFVA